MHTSPLSASSASACVTSTPPSPQKIWPARYRGSAGNRPWSSAREIRPYQSTRAARLRVATRRSLRTSGLIDLIFGIAASDVLPAKHDSADGEQQRVIDLLMASNEAEGMRLRDGADKLIAQIGPIHTESPST